MSVHNLQLNGATEREREAAARDALAAITPHSGDDFALVMGAPSLSGYTPVAAILLQTLKEARVFAEENGFRPVGFSARKTPSGFDFTPAFEEPIDYGPLKRKAAFAAGVAAALVAGAVLFFLVDPYGIWTTPPRVADGPAGLPGPGLPAVPAGVGFPVFEDFGPLPPRPDAIRSASRPGAMPHISGVTGAAGAQVTVQDPRTAPETGAPADLRIRADKAPGSSASPPAMHTATADVVLDRTGPELFTHLKAPPQPSVVSPSAGPEVPGEAAALLGPMTIGPIATEPNPSRELPGRTVTRAFPLDNLEPIMAAARSLRAAAGPFGGVTSTGTSAPEIDIGFAAAAAVPAPARPDGQPATDTMPSVGPVAALRPAGKPRKRPEDLRTVGEFERPVATPVTPRLALTVPAAILRSLERAEPSDQAPSDPLLLVAMLSSGRISAFGETPAPPRSEFLTASLASPATLELLSRGEQPFSPPPSAPIRTVPGAEAVPAPVIADESVPRPRRRPVSIAKPGEGTVPAAGETGDRYAGIRPKHRPKSVQQRAERNDLSPTDLALASSRRPKARPATLELKAASLRRARGVPAGSPEVQMAPGSQGTKLASLPTNASVQRAATIRHGFNRNRISLMGVYGTPSKRRALIRMPGGKFYRVSTGDKFRGYQVASIGSDFVKLIYKGRSTTLKMPAN
ncbi:MAG: hypothetical protein ACE5FS_04030 [Paracoccaceae bacterium]